MQKPILILEDVCYVFILAMHFVNAFWLVYIMSVSVYFLSVVIVQLLLLHYD